jgi:hypothetical protein
MCRTAAEGVCHMLQSRGDGLRSVGESYSRSRSVVGVSVMDRDRVVSRGGSDEVGERRFGVFRARKA